MVYGIEFTIDKMNPKFNKGAEKCDLNWSDSFVEFENAPGPSQNCLETGASRALSRAHQCNDASAGYARW